MNRVRLSRAPVLVGMVLGLLGTAPAAENPEMGDVRDIRVGVAADSLPTKGYTRWRCVGAAESQSIDGWSSFRDCPTNASGQHEVAFEFDESTNPWAKVSDRWEGTKVGGHPVNLSLRIDDAGIVTSLHIATDPEARPYMRKKAFLLRLRIMGRYGRDGWACEKRPRGNGYSAVGGMYINETCTKRLADRELTMTTHLLRGPDQSASEYTNATQLDIRWLGES